MQRIHEPNFINMNGHPVIGRFFSPDPYVQLPNNTQNYNRYSYCLNNPLLFTDPSGYQVNYIGFYTGRPLEIVDYRPSAISLWNKGWVPAEWILPGGPHYESNIDGITIPYEPPFSRAAGSPKGSNRSSNARNSQNKQSTPSNPQVVEKPSTPSNTNSQDPLLPVISMLFSAAQVLIENYGIYKSTENSRSLLWTNAILDGGSIYLNTENLLSGNMGGWEYGYETGKTALPYIITGAAGSAAAAGAGPAIWAFDWAVKTLNRTCYELDVWGRNLPQRIFNPF